jgi:hypothetical protein
MLEENKELKKVKLKSTDMITVCDMCLRSCCWHGEFMCDDAQCAGTIDLSVETLKKIQKHLNSVGCGEHSDYWKQDKWERNE